MSRRPRIVTIADHIDCPTGFGVQHRHLAVALANESESTAANSI